jgi:hypothetical protein
MCHPEVDYGRTVSNDIIEMLSTLGIEAARNALLKELRGEGVVVHVGGWVGGAGGCGDGVLVCEIAVILTRTHSPRGR